MSKYVVVDIETTGHSLTNDKIIEIGMVMIENNQIIDDYSTMLNPNQSIPSFISSLTGIKDEDVMHAPEFHEKAEEISHMLRDSYFIAHNVPFDLGFINAELKNNGLMEITPKVIDTVELSRILFPQAPSFKLNQLANYLGIEHDQPHRAFSDAYVTAKLFLKLQKKLINLPNETKIHLLKMEKLFHSNLKNILHQDTEDIARLKHIDTFQGIAYKRPLDNFQDEEDEFHSLSYGDFLDNIYEENGAMEQNMKAYEKRCGQREMSEIVYDQFQSKSHVLIEAETGIGKSLAYLFPAIYESVRTKERIIISTFTTQLQSQLLEEEIPLLEKLIPFPFSVALLKGKSNYISLERFAYSLASEQEENYDITLSKAIILVWLTETVTGDIDEIQLPSNGYKYFKTISTESESFVDSKSPWYLRSYYQKAYLRAQRANIIITNHALLSIDLLNEYNYLPTYQKVIIDEAHHFETVASKHYGLKLDYVSIINALNQIGTTEDQELLNRLIKKYPILNKDDKIKKWDLLFTNIKFELDDLFTTIFQYVMERKGRNKNFSDIGRIQYRLADEQNRKWQLIQDMAGRLIFMFQDLIQMVIHIDQHIDQNDPSSKYDQEDLYEQIEQLETFVKHFDHFFINDLTGQVKWIEVDSYGAKNSVYIYSEPKQIATLLEKSFFNQKESVVLTSATLTMRNSFSFIKSRLGLTSDHVSTFQIQSPFSYERQVQLLVPNDFPHVDEEDFIYSTCEAIISLAHVTKGRMLVLFTSYDMLRKAYNLLREMMSFSEFMVIAQGVSSGSRTRLKKNFQTFDQAILLGTSSFWEGVDIPGEDLSALVIVRLPFQPPNHPVLAAKSEDLKNSGKNPFFELALPHAVLRFKQGFGRLIRSTNDRGIIFVCDARLMNTRYGKIFIDSIPTVPIHYHSTYDLIKVAEEWF